MGHVHSSRTISEGLSEESIKIIDELCVADTAPMPLIWPWENTAMATSGRITFVPEGDHITLSQRISLWMLGVVSDPALRHSKGI